MDTIFALASGRGKAGVAVIRVSGPRAFDIGRALTGGAVPVGRPVLRRLIEASGAQIDEALVLGFANGASFTGEATVEFHCHGSVAVTQALVRRLSEFEGTRLAEPGEFTRRALENDRLNLAQVEGLADLVDAETEAQRKQALRLLSGELGRLAHGWREKLVRAAALMEATIDFADEEVPVNVAPEVAGLLAEVRDALASEIRGAVVSERIRDGFEVAIVGRPNTGKSTLLNHMAGRDVAITSEIAGTTRDVLEVRLDLRGLPVTLLDTAGLREAMDAVEAQGIARARRRAENADLRVFLLADPDEIPELPIRADDIVVVGKADMAPGRDGVSGVTGEGVDRLVERLADILEKRASGAATATRVRQRLAMERAVEYTGLGIGELAAGEARAEYAAEEIRHAIRALDALIGRVDVEHLLDEIFRSFCLGK